MKLQAGICDDVMETAWSTMWNVTDETPVNCERFLAGGGMYLFLKVPLRHQTLVVSSIICTYLTQGNLNPMLQMNTCSTTYTAHSQQYQSIHQSNVSEVIPYILHLYKTAVAPTFPQCKERFPEKADLLRNMMGLLGNVAEVLHHHCLTIAIIIIIIVIIVKVTMITISSARCQSFVTN